MKIRHNARYRQGDAEYATNGAEKSDNFSQWCYREHITVSHSGHGNNSPPKCMRDWHENFPIFVDFAEIDEGWKKDHRNDKEKHEET